MHAIDLTEDSAQGPSVPGTQTLMRGLDLIEAVRQGPLRLVDLSGKLGLSRTTTHRLASALIDRGYIAYRSPGWLTLGPMLLRLGAAAQGSIGIQAIARPHMAELSNETGLCAFIGIRDGDHSLHLARVAGRQRLMVSTNPGDRRPIAQTGLGKALLLDEPADALLGLYRAGFPDNAGDTAARAWIEAVRRQADAGYVVHNSRPEEAIRSVAAPIRDASGDIVAAISVASAAQYITDDRVETIVAAVRHAAVAVSHELGGETMPAAGQVGAGRRR